MEFKKKILTVTEVANQISDVITESMPPVWIEGEVSNYYKSRAGHIYLSLKDENALINATIWSYLAGTIQFPIKDGMCVIIYGDIVTYKLRSQYQVKVRSISVSGLGDLHAAFEKLKNKLVAEGLFDSELKKPIPKFPKRIGVITSPTSAAVRDIIQVSGRRNPNVQLIVYPAVVQGDQAAETIINGIRYFNQDAYNIDMIIVSRGGGSLEDLWAFNEEPVIRAIFESNLPIVTGIGHEIDFTLSDFAADYRAPTPSAAAEESIPDINEINRHINYCEKRLLDTMGFRVSNLKAKLTNLEKQIGLLNPLNTLENQKQHIDGLEKRIIFTINNKFKQYLNKVNYLSSTLKSLNPTEILERGYSIVMDKSNKIVNSVTKLKENDLLKVRVSDGIIGTQVKSIENNKNEMEEQNE